MAEHRRLYDSDSKKPRTPAQDCLNTQESLFVSEFLRDLNPSKAGVRAGYPDGKGLDLIREPKIWKAVRKKLDTLQKQAEATVRYNSRIKAERVLQEFASIAFSDPRKCANPNGLPKNIHEIDDDTAAAISSVEFTEIWEGTGEERRPVGLKTKYRFWSKTEGLTNLGKYLRLFPTQIEGKMQHEHVHAHVTLSPEELEAIPLDVRRKMLERLRAQNAQQIEYHSQSESSAESEGPPSGTTS